MESATTQRVPESTATKKVRVLLSSQVTDDDATPYDTLKVKVGNEKETTIEES